MPKKPAKPRPAPALPAATLERIEQARRKKDCTRKADLKAFLEVMKRQERDWDQLVSKYASSEEQAELRCAEAIIVDPGHPDRKRTIADLQLFARKLELRAELVDAEPEVRRAAWESYNNWCAETREVRKCLDGVGWSAATFSLDENKLGITVSPEEPSVFAARQSAFKTALYGTRFRWREIKIGTSTYVGNGTFIIEIV